MGPYVSNNNSGVQPACESRCPTHPGQHNMYLFCRHNPRQSLQKYLSMFTGQSGYFNRVYWPGTSVLNHVAWRQCNIFWQAGRSIGRTKSLLVVDGPGLPKTGALVPLHCWALAVIWQQPLVVYQTSSSWTIKVGRHVPLLFIGGIQM